MVAVSSLSARFGFFRIATHGRQKDFFQGGWGAVGDFPKSFCRGGQKW